MNLYLDDDSVADVLLRHLSDRGHDPQIPTAAGTAGQADAILESTGHHPGILTVRSDNDPTRDLSPRAICLAISKLQASGVPIADSLHVLNHWR